VRPRREPRLGLLVPFVLAAAGATSAGCRSHASPDDCREMEDRYLDLAVKEAPGAAAMSSAQTAAVREVERGLKRAEPSYRAVEDHCAAVTRAEVSCALDAKTTRAWEACVQAPDAR
jgi:hypothetical protein